MASPVTSPFVKLGGGKFHLAFRAVAYGADLCYLDPTLCSAAGSASSCFAGAGVWHRPCCVGARA